MSQITSTVGLTFEGEIRPLSYSKAIERKFTVIDKTIVDNKEHYVIVMAETNSVEIIPVRQIDNCKLLTSI